MRKDVLIIGGGVIGCAVAYYLAKEGIRSVVLERDTIGAHASSAAAGMLGAQSEMSAPGPLTDLCLRSRALFPSLQAELLEITGLDIELNQSGLLKVAFEEEEAHRLMARGKWQKSIGQKADWLHPSDLRELVPALHSKAVGALYLPDDGQVSAPRLTRAFALAAQNLGAEIVEGCQVIDVKRDGERIEEVVTSHGKWRAEWVVLATGAWSRWVANWLDLHLPVYAIKGESLSLTPAQPLFTHTIFTERVYLVPKVDGQVIVGATEKPHDWSVEVSAEAIQTLLQSAIQTVPALAHGKLNRFWASARPGSSDGTPFIGPITAIANLLVASGHQRNGILLSPITGQSIAQLILEKELEWIRPFHPERLLLATKE